MSETMESYLVGYEDPRLSKFWQPSVNTGEYKGVRNGMNTEEIVASENEPDNTSGPSEYLMDINQSTTPSTVMYAASLFPSCRGLLNGWNMGGTAKELYETGIELSLYLGHHRCFGHGAISTAAKYHLLRVVISPPVADIPLYLLIGTPAEQIGTQKWLRSSEGHEDGRLSGSPYPEMYPLIHSDNPDARLALSSSAFLSSIMTGTGTDLRLMQQNRYWGGQII
jgi:hypothetical protein